MEDWTVGEARRRLSALLRATAAGPQRIYSRDRLVAVVVDPATFDQLSAKQPSGSLADDFAELRRLCAEERYELPIERRVDRPDTSFATAD